MEDQQAMCSNCISRCSGLIIPGVHQHLVGIRVNRNPQKHARMAKTIEVCAWLYEIKGSHLSIMHHFMQVAARSRASSTPRARTDSTWKNHAPMSMRDETLSMHQWSLYTGQVSRRGIQITWMGSRAARDLRRRDLPTPLGPRMKSTSPGETEKEMLARITRSPTSLVSPRTTSMCCASPLCYIALTYSLAKKKPLCSISLYLTILIWHRIDFCIPRIYLVYDRNWQDAVT